MTQFLMSMLVSAQSGVSRVREERGANAMEYLIIIGIIALVVFVIFTALGGQMHALWDHVSEMIDKVTGADGS